ncbi:sensor histidine kinase [Aquimarina sp. MMG016]|uniref:sensor histidine kinase n=1 Tax=Aquimarina sp. MMG016 TaxID=2822690 RepID=UPI001B3A6301|nr:sensor histidine kinase [Aquimarina sp. MMG016]MBQ4820377.1 sensor histidine kinase [Aquimarina sp. MMG016]
MRYLLFVTLLFSIIPFSFAQEKEYSLNQAELLFQKGKYEEAKLELEKSFKDNIINTDYCLFLSKIYARQFQMRSSLYWLKKAKNHANEKFTKTQEFHYNLWLGFNYEINKNYFKSYEHYIKALEISQKIDIPYYKNFLYMQGLSLLGENDYKDRAKKWIDSYKEFVNKLNNEFYLNSYYYALTNYFHHKKESDSTILYADKYLKSSKAIKNTSRLVNAYTYKGIACAEHKKNQDSARFYHHLAMKICSCPENSLIQGTYKYNIARTYILDSNRQKAKKWLYKAWKDTSQIRNNYRFMKISKDLDSIYFLENNYDSAYYFAKQFKRFSDSTKISQTKRRLDSIQMESEIAEQKNESIINKKKATKNKIIASSLAGGLISVCVIAFLIYKNTKRKQRIAEQEREIQVQKTEKVLKEQELATIDAMISGQEKERQRLANDLHDNLGSTLATVKLHFNHLLKNRSNSKAENIEELYSKTNTLLEEAYQKVRSIAHEKNSGVMANQGLLPAIKSLAKKVSNGKNLKIEVQDFGLDERLDNSLEISIFRIIQELITNIIKHANASEIHISLTNHDSLLNIIIEDNGKGFDNKILPEKDGMGLRNIEKRIEHMEGTFEIDSTIGKGTNIIINIPI